MTEMGYVPQVKGMYYVELSILMWEMIDMSVVWSLCCGKDRMFYVRFGLIGLAYMLVGWVLMLIKHIMYYVILMMLCNWYIN